MFVHFWVHEACGHVELRIQAVGPYIDGSTAPSVNLPCPLCHMEGPKWEFHGYASISQMGFSPIPQHI